MWNGMPRAAAREQTWKSEQNEISFHKANGYEWSSPSPVHCWTWTMNLVFNPDNPCTLWPHCHGITQNMASESVLLHFAPSKMLQSVSKQNFKTGAAISAVIDPASVVEGQKHSKALSSAWKTQGFAHTWTAVCIIPMPRFFWCVQDSLQGQVDWHSLCCSIIPLWPGKANALSTFSPSQFHEQQQYESWCSNSPTVIWNRVMDLSIFATSLMALAQLRTIQQWSPKGNDQVGPCLQGQKLSNTMFWNSFPRCLCWGTRMRDLFGTCKNIKNFVACAVSRSFCRLAANHPEFLGCGLLYQTVVSKRKWPSGPVPSRAKAIKHHVLKFFPSLSVLGYTDAGSVWYMQEHQEFCCMPSLKVFLQTCGQPPWVSGLLLCANSSHWSNWLGWSLNWHLTPSSLLLALARWCVWKPQAVPTREKKPVCFVRNPGSPLRPFHRVLLCPLNISKITMVHGVGCSLNLSIS